MTRIKNRKELCQRLPGVYGWLLMNDINLLDRVLPSTRLKLTEQDVILNAKQYTTKKQWETLSPKYYGKARKLGIINKCSHHMTKIIGKWNDETAYAEALKYRSKTEWIKGSPGSYGFAHKTKKINQFSVHMKRPLSIKLTPVYCLELSKVFDSLNSASAFTGKTRESIGTALKMGTKCGGYRWAYCDENGKILNERTKK